MNLAPNSAQFHQFLTILEPFFDAKPGRGFAEFGAERLWFGKLKLNFEGVLIVTAP